MWRILVENARRKQSLKQGGHIQRVDADLDGVAEIGKADELLAIDAALSKLATENPPVARLVELRYFAGRSVDEAAGILDVTSRTAHRHWAYARAWRRREVESLRESASGCS